MEFLTSEQIKKLENEGVYDIETGRDQIIITKHDNEGNEYDGYASVDPDCYIMRIDNATVALDPEYDNIYDSIVVYEAPSIWYGMSLVSKVIKMINSNKSKKKELK